MADFRITFKEEGLDEVSDRLQKLLDRIENPGPTIMRELGDYMVRSTRYRIDSGRRVGPDGEPWPALSYTTVKIREKRKPRRYKYGRWDPLRESGYLKNSVYTSSAGSDDFEVTAGAEYAALLQEGGETDSASMIPGAEVPARPFMGFSNANIDKIARKLSEYIRSGRVQERQDYDL